MDADKIEMIAKVCHEANRAYCAAHGDNSHACWDEAPSWQKTSAINGVTFHLMEGCGPVESHSNWMDEKIANGWKYGPVKDAEKKEHPCLVPWHELPVEQRAKDRLFIAIVNALR